MFLFTREHFSQEALKELQAMLPTAKPVTFIILHKFDSSWLFEPHYLPEHTFTERVGALQALVNTFARSRD